MASGILASGIVTNTNMSTVYTCPSGKLATVKLYLTITGGGSTGAYALINNSLKYVSGSSPLNTSVSLVMAAGQTIIIYSYGVDIGYIVSGYEE